MKKQFLIIPCIAMILTACGGGKSDNTSSNASSENSSSVNNDDKKTAEKDFIADITNIRDNENYTAEAYYTFLRDDNKRNPYGVLEQYNKKSVYWIDEQAGSIGILLNGDKGIFEYTLDSNNDVVLGSFVNFSGGYSLGNYAETPAALADPEMWEMEDDKSCFVCRDTDVITFFAGLTGITYAADQTGTRLVNGILRGTYDDNNNLYFYLNAAKGDNAYVKGELLVYKIGQTNNAKVEEYVTTTHDVPAKTGWSEAEQVQINKYFGGTNAEPLPFPEGASYAMTVKGLAEYNEVMITDIGSGDISKDYLEKLEGEGYKVTDTSEYSIATKTVAKGSTNYSYEIYVTYYTNSYIKKVYGYDTAKFYPKGRFQIEAMASRVTNSTLHTGTLAEFDSWMDTNAKYEFPKTGWTNVTYVQFADRTEQYNGIYASEGIVYKSVTSVKFFIDAEADAKANYDAFEQKLLGLGYEKTEVPEGNLMIAYFILGKAEIDLCINYNGKDYGGFVQAMYWVEQ